jgi:hypothetical protein
VARRLGIVLVSLAGTLGISCQGEPKNYDDCILRYTKSGMGKEAAALVEHSCREKFPRESPGGTAHGPAVRELTPSELSLLSVEPGLGHTYGDYFTGTMYNGSTLTIVEVRIEIEVGGGKPRAVYRAEVRIPPLQSGTVGLDLPERHSRPAEKASGQYWAEILDWKVVGAKADLRQQ